MKKRLLLAVVAGLALAAAAPAVAQGPTLTLAIAYHPDQGEPGPPGTATTVLYGQDVILSGELSNVEKNWNEPIELTISPIREPREIVTDGTGDYGTRFRGRFEYSDSPGTRTTYSARWRNVSTAQVVAHVRPKVGLRALRDGRFRVTVGANPRHVSRVAFFQRRVTLTRWATVRRVRLNARSYLEQPGRSAIFRAKLPRGTQRVRIVVPQAPGYLSATSRVALVRS